MKLVTICKAGLPLSPEYVPGKCNIGARGRAIRLSTGAVLIGLSVIAGLTVLNGLYWLARLALFIPIYIGVLAALEGWMSFCVLHAALGTYDFQEPHGFASQRSPTMNKVQSDDWKKLDRSKARKMHGEALAGAIVLAVLLAFA